MFEPIKKKMGIIILIMVVLLGIMLLSECNYQMPSRAEPMLIFHPDDTVPPDWFIPEYVPYIPDTIVIDWDTLSSQ